MNHRRRFLRLATSALAALAAAGCAMQAAVPESARQALAPTGVLRVGLYQGSPSSILVGAPGQERGVGFDLGKALAARLGVPFQPVVFPKNAEVLAGVQAGTLDVTFTNASPERARRMDFSPTFMDVEKSFLVGPASPATSIADMKRPGLRIGVSEGSSTEAELAPGYPSATAVRASTLKAGIDMLADGRIDAFATNKAILFEMADALPGSRVLPGRWGTEHFAAGIPKGREAGRAAIDAFVRDALAEGTVARAIARAGLRGTVAPATP